MGRLGLPLVDLGSRTPVAVTPPLRASWINGVAATFFDSGHRRGLLGHLEAPAREERQETRTREARLEGYP